MVWVQTISGHQTIHIMYIYIYTHIYIYRVYIVCIYIYILQSNCHDQKHTHCRSKRLKFCDPLACAASASRSSCVSLSSRGSLVWPAEASPGMGDRRHVQNLAMSLYTGGFTGVPLMDSDIPQCIINYIYIYIHICIYIYVYYLYILYSPLYLSTNGGLEHCSYGFIPRPPGNMDWLINSRGASLYDIYMPCATRLPSACVYNML